MVISPPERETVGCSTDTPCDFNEKWTFLTYLIVEVSTGLITYDDDTKLPPNIARILSRDQRPVSIRRNCIRN